METRDAIEAYAVGEVARHYGYQLIDLETTSESYNAELSTWVFVFRAPKSCICEIAVHNNSQKVRVVSLDRHNTD